MMDNNNSNNNDTYSQNGKENNENIGMNGSGNNAPRIQFNVELNQDYFIKFPPEAGTPLFDECNNEVVIINDNEFYRYVMPTPHSPAEARKYAPTKPITHSGQVNAAKFSLDHKWFAYQQGECEVQFMHLESPNRFAQPTKKPLLGFYWTHGSDNVFFVTQGGVELYQTVPKSKSLRLVKEFKQPTAWFVYSHKNRVLLTSNGSASVYGFYFRGNALNKIPKFDVELAAKEQLQPSDISIAQLYQKLYCLHNNSKKQEVVLYKLSRDSVTPVYRLTLFIFGPIFFHVVDDLIIIHGTDSKLALIYDLKSETEKDYPVAAPLTLAPFTKIAAEVEFYNKNWSFYGPNFIMDSAAGFVWEVELNLEAISYSFSEKPKLIDFLLRRSLSHQLILKILKNTLEDAERLGIVSILFDKLNLVVQASEKYENEMRASKRSVRNTGGPSDRINTPPPNPPTSSSGIFFDLSLPFASFGLASSENVRPDDFTVAQIAIQTTSSSPALSAISNGPPSSSSMPSILEEPKSKRNNEGYQVIDQVDMYRFVFSPIDDHGALDYKYLVAVLTEYIRSLNAHLIQIKHFLYELVIRLLVKNTRFYQLHQFLQYHVISDSIPVAHQLLSLETIYPPAYQLALDMLKRLVAPGQIVEVLLSRNQVLAALKIMRSIKDPREIAKISASRFLEAALQTNDSTLFYTVFKYFFEQRPKEISADCKKFIEIYYNKFPRYPSKES